jgi:hypothetical protein
LNADWDCETDYEEDESPWILFADQKPSNGQRCLTWPGMRVRYYRTELNAFVAHQMDTGDHNSTEYWMPMPDDPVRPEDHMRGTLAEIFSDDMKPLIGEEVGEVKEKLLAALGIPVDMLTGEDPPKVTNVTDKGGGEIEFELELPLPLNQLGGTYAAEDDTDGNDS